MAEIPRRIFGPASFPATAALIYTVPAATTFVLRSLAAFTGDPTDYTFTLSVGPLAPGNAIFEQQIVPGSSYFDWMGNIALTPGKTLYVSANVASKITGFLAGIEVT